MRAKAIIYCVHLQALDEIKRGYKRDRKGSIETTQQVEIYFNFVGRYVPPRFGEVNLTPEEQEELRKKEERKDRLHQNYLKRKANGKQKEYEERTKAKKKTEMDAKKNALRAEDMGKGVFVPVSALPKKNRRKQNRKALHCRWQRISNSEADTSSDEVSADLILSMME